MTKWIIAALCGWVSTSATIIQDTNRVDWGYAGASIVTRTSLVDVTQAPYSVDSTGTSDASTGINAAIVAAASNSVIYLPSGRYMITSRITVGRSDVTLRGNGPGHTVVFSTNNLGSVMVNVALSTATSGHQAITGGAVKGATSFTVDSAASIDIGDTGYVSQSNDKGTELFNVFSSGMFTNIMRELVLVTGKAGTTITTASPLGFTYDAAPVSWDGIAGIPALLRIGIEDIKFSFTNSGFAGVGTATFMINMGNASRSWITGCETEQAQNYHIFAFQGTQNTIAHNYSHGAQSAGSNHAGYLLADLTWSRIEDNILADGLQPAVEWNGGVCNNVFLGNFLTNNVKDFSCHGAHPKMNLFEQNYATASSGMDGYFGSGGPNVWFRNRIEFSIYLKRWETYQQIVGNVLGLPGYTFSGLGFIYEFTGQTYRPYIFQFGYPGVGNDTFTGTNPPIAWNYPGKHFTGFSNESLTNGIYTFTSDQVNTTNLSGMFTNIPAPAANGYPILFQDGVNTNVYWPQDGPLYAYAAGTETNLLLARPTTVSNGWTVYIGGQNAYPQWQSAQRVTHTITENYVCTNIVDYTRAFDPAVGDTNVPVSLVYTNAAPDWWTAAGASWPAFGPGVSDLIQPNPAMLRYYAALAPPVAAAILSGGATLRGAFRFSSP